MTPDCMHERLCDLEAQLTELAASFYSTEMPRTRVLREAAWSASGALELCTELVAASTMAETARQPTRTEFLLARIGGLDRGAEPLAEDELEKRLPWLLHMALELLLQSDEVHRSPSGPEAVVARMLATIVAAQEKHVRLRQAMAC